MIDIDTGSVDLHSDDGTEVLIRPKERLTDELRIKLERYRLKDSYPSMDYILYLFTDVAGERFGASVRFADGFCTDVGLTVTSPGQGDWSNFTEERLQEEKRRADQVMVALTGATKAYFPWGEMESVLDTRTGCADIWITYA